jgi:hypothetical protein
MRRRRRLLHRSRKGARVVRAGRIESAHEPTLLRRQAIGSGATRGMTANSPVSYRSAMDLPTLADVVLNDADGNEVRIGDLLVDNTTVLVFLRHFG